MKAICFNCYRIFDSLKSVVRDCEDCWVVEEWEKVIRYKAIANNLKDYAKEKIAEMESEE